MRCFMKYQNLQYNTGYHQAPAPGTSQNHTQAASLTLDFFNVFHGVIV